MKSRIVLLTSVLISSLLSTAFSNTTKHDPKIELIVTANSYVGVRTDSTLVFYLFQEGWKHYDGWDIILPGKTDELVMSSIGQVGIRIGNELEFKEVSTLFGALLDTDSLDFKIPDSVDELILSIGGDLGVRTGNKLKFYLFNKEWKPNEAYDHTLPAGTDELIITTTGMLGVRIGNELKFYNVTNKYEHVKQFDFTLPKEVEELLMANEELGVRIGKNLKFYKFTDKWEPVPELDFKIEVPVVEE